MHNESFEAKFPIGKVLKQNIELYEVPTSIGYYENAFNYIICRVDYWSVVCLYD